jgi:predicted phage tail protein
MEVLREIRLHGVLGKRFGRVHHLAVASVAEAVQALCAVLPGFEVHLLRYSEPGYRVWVGKHTIGEQDLAAPVGTREVIRITPVVRGAKRGGVLQSIVGAVLVIVGTIVGVYYSPTAGSYIVNAGIAMIVGGVIQMLSPQRKGNDNTVENVASYNFGGPVNVADEGGAVPVCYGRMVIGSVVISGGIATSEYALVSTPAQLSDGRFPVQIMPAEQHWVQVGG